MDGFKKIVKMKTGGLVKTPVTGDKKANAQSKAAVKPAFAGSDIAKEKNKPSGHKDLYIKSKESGKTADFPSAAVKGRKAKAEGTVSKFKCGGNVKKMADGGAFLQKPGKPAGTVTADKKGGKVKKFQVGGSTGIMADLATLEEKRRLEKLGRTGQLGPAQQTELLNQPGGQAAAGVAPAIPANSALPPAAPAAMPQQDQMGAPTGMPMQKRGGKVKGKC